MAIKHINPYGRVEYLDKLPVRDCSCDKCERARRKERGGRRNVGRAVAEGIITGVTALSGAAAQPPADVPHEAGDAYERSRSGLVDNRDEYLDEQTRATNDRKGGSSRSR